MSTTEDEPERHRSRRRLRLTVEYDGTDFAGFQLQGKGERTIQGTLEAAIQKVSGEFCRVHGAGRTDAGVHATGQVIHFETGWGIPVERLPVALNSGALPRDLVVREGHEAEPDFHARFSATARVYRYTILCRSLPSALLRRYAMHVRAPLDLPAMREAAAELTGSRDFAAFGLPAARGHSTVRWIEKIDVRSVKDCVLITVKGNAFLKHMVRAFVSTLVSVGLGRMPPSGVRALRESLDWTCCPSIAPPHGLCLVRVEYNGIRHQFGMNQEE